LSLRKKGGRGVDLQGQFDLSPKKPDLTPLKREKKKGGGESELRPSSAAWKRRFLGCHCKNFLFLFERDDICAEKGDNIVMSRGRTRKT